MERQLSFDSQFSVYYPPKGQLLKWVGNKQRYAAEIARYFPKDFGFYYEPFLGSGALMATVAPQNGFGCDVFKPLIEIWEELINKPKNLIGWYAEWRNKLTNDNKGELYEQVKAAFNKSPSGKDFIYLSRACYGGIVRFRKADGYMSTPCGAHTPIPVDSFSYRVKEWHNRVKRIRVERMDYKEAFHLANKGDLIYCDPPYRHSQSILYGAQDFSLEELLSTIAKAKRKGVRVALSIDGKKKSGNYIYDLPIPEGLFKNEIFISLGRSMLKRFQMNGESLENEVVTDRLMITY